MVFFVSLDARHQENSFMAGRPDLGLASLSKAKPGLGTSSVCCLCRCEKDHERPVNDLMALLLRQLRSNLREADGEQIERVRKRLVEESSRPPYVLGDCRRSDALANPRYLRLQVPIGAGGEGEGGGRAHASICSSQRP